MNDYLKIPFVEIEIRFGTIGKTFDSSVDVSNFNKIMNTLRGNQWLQINEYSTIEHISKGVKLIDDSDIIMKENVYTKTMSLPSGPFDVRFSINQEFQLNSYLNSFSKNNCVIRKKNRTSFIEQNFRYDLTHVKETINGIHKEKNEVEFELIANQETIKWSNEYIMDFIQCKVYDIINIVEETDFKNFKLNLLN